MIPGNELLNIINRPSMRGHFDISIREQHRAGWKYGRAELKKTIDGGIMFGIIMNIYNSSNNSSNNSYNDPYIYVTLRIFPELRICLPMGVQRNFHIKDIIPKSSFILHTFWSSFISNKYPDIKYSIVQPVGGMLHNFIQNMKYNDGSFIPIAVGFLGDIEYYFEPNKYGQKFIDTHKNINLIYLKIRLSGDCKYIDEAGKKIILDKYNEDENEINKLEKENIQTILNSNVGEYFCPNCKNYKKLINNRKNITDYIYPNPLELLDGNIIIKYNEEEIKISFENFYNIIALSLPLSDFFNRVTLLTMKIEDLNKKWNEYENPIEI